MHDTGLNLKLKRKSNVIIMTSISLLLLTFFVALAALSTPDKKKAGFGISSIAEGFNVKSAKNVYIKNPSVLSADEMRKALASAGVVKGTSLYPSKAGTTLAIKSDMLFEPDSHIIKPGASEKLGAIASLIKDMPNEIIISGFTDSRPLESTVYSSNWVLSAARAMSVMEYFALNGILEKKMRVYGMGPEHPVASNSTASGRSINSRIEITLTGMLDSETGRKVKEIKKGQDETPSVYRYKGLNIPLGENNEKKEK